MTDANSGAEDEAVSTREKYRRIAEHRRYPKKKTYSFDELALGLTAMEAGVNRYYAMAAGRPAKRVLNYLAQAAKATKPETKAKALKLARQCMGDLSRDRHPELAEQIESRILWEEGWRPETWDAERNAPRAQGASVNPETGMQEFFFGGTEAQEIPEITVSAQPWTEKLGDIPTTDGPFYQELRETVMNPSGNGIERNDGAGSGWQGASRRDGPHKGVDITMEKPGDPVFAPIEGVVSDNRGQPYRDKIKNGDLRILDIEGTGPHAGLLWRTFYLDKNLPKIGTTLKPGDPMGNYLDVTKAHKDQPNMGHHIHVETFYKGKQIDPALLLPNWKSQRPK